MMLRRFEIYSIADRARPADVDHMVRATRDCARFIPEVLHCAIGWNRADNPLHFVWEQAYASPAAYVRYMEHPFHANLLDRFLMTDSAERVTRKNGLGAGLLGYTCDTAEYYLPPGTARRVVALRLVEGGEAEFATITEEARRAGAMTLSVFKENTFGPRWFDGETWVGPAPTFTHLWEQGFASIDAAVVDSAPWRAAAASLVENSIETVYAIEPGYGYV
jgi:hypothetical protein